MMYEIAKAKGSLLVLCYLTVHDGVTRYELARNLKFSREAIDHAVATLIRMGLCENRRSGEFPFARTIRLTRLGVSFMDTRVKDLPGFFWRNQGLRIPRAEPEPVRLRRSLLDPAVR